MRIADRNVVRLNLKIFWILQFFIMNFKQNYTQKTILLVTSLVMFYTNRTDVFVVTFRRHSRERRPRPNSLRHRIASVTCFHAEFLSTIRVLVLSSAWRPLGINSYRERRLPRNIICRQSAWPRQKEMNQSPNWTEYGFTLYIPLDAKYVISETFSAADLLARHWMGERNVRVMDRLMDGN